MIDGLYEKISEIRSDGYPCSNPILHLLQKKTEAETSLPRDYAEIAASGILRAVTEYNSISFYADGDTVSGFHYELLHAFAHSKGLKPEITPEMSFSKRLEGVQKGTYDILANSTVVTTEYKDSCCLPAPLY